MGTKRAKELIVRARRLLQDLDNTYQRWSDPDLLDALNEGQLALVQLKHDAYTRNESVRLVPGTKQQIPDDGIAFIRLTRNMGPDGNTPGRAISQTTIDALDVSDPNWHTASSSQTVWQYATDDRDDLHYFVSPPGIEQVELIYTVVPVDIPSLNAPITLADSYAPALVQYVCYSALSQDMDNATNQQLAGRFFQQFIALVTGKIQAEQNVTPNA